ncbi:MAG: hypothetical protein EBR52_08930, partial [Microbacteriaceae bacterium]|nr:hypothetical protein [Microbacteriaceae bacterium]
GMANKTSALENACTSALGRALRWAFAGSKGPSREEMQKVSRAVPAPDDLTEKLEAVISIDGLQRIYEQGVAAGWMTEDVRVLFTARKAELKDA